MLKILRKLITFKSQKEKNYNLLCHLKQTGYTEEEVDVIKRHYSFLKVNEDNFSIYKHDFTKEFIEITPLGNLCSGRIDLHNYELEEIDKVAW